MLAIEFDARGIVALEADAAKLSAAWPRVKVEIMTSAVDWLEQRVARNIRDSDLLFRRVLLTSVTSQVLSQGAGADSEVTGTVYSDAPYASVMEEGRRPGAKRPPAEALEQWASEKLMGAGIKGPRRKDTRAEVKGLAFVVARSIGKKGIKGRFPFKRALDDLPPVMDRIAETVLAEVLP